MHNNYKLDEQAITHITESHIKLIRKTKTNKTYHLLHQI